SGIFRAGHEQRRSAFRHADQSTRGFPGKIRPLWNHYKRIPSGLVDLPIRNYVHEILTLNQRIDYTPSGIDVTSPTAERPFRGRIDRMPGEHNAHLWHRLRMVTGRFTLANELRQTGHRVDIQLIDITGARGLVINLKGAALRQNYTGFLL